MAVAIKSSYLIADCVFLVEGVGWNERYKPGLWNMRPASWSIPGWDAI